MRTKACGTRLQARYTQRPFVEAIAFDLSATLASKFKGRSADTKSAGTGDLKEQIHFPEVLLAFIVS